MAKVKNPLKGSQGQNPFNDELTTMIPAFRATVFAIT